MNHQWTCGRTGVACTTRIDGRAWDMTTAVASAVVTMCASSTPAGARRIHGSCSRWVPYPSAATASTVRYPVVRAALATRSRTLAASRPRARRRIVTMRTANPANTPAGACTPCTESGPPMEPACTSTPVAAWAATAPRRQRNPPAVRGRTARRVSRPSWPRPAPPTNGTPRATVGSCAVRPAQMRDARSRACDSAGDPAVGFHDYAFPRNPTSPPDRTASRCSRQRSITFYARGPVQRIPVAAPALLQETP